MITSTFHFIMENMFHGNANHLRPAQAYVDYNLFPKKIKGIFHILPRFSKKSNIFKLALAKYSTFC